MKQLPQRRWLRSIDSSNVIPFGVNHSFFPFMLHQILSLFESSLLESPCNVQIGVDVPIQKVVHFTPTV